MANKKSYMVTRGFFSGGVRHKPKDVIELTEQEAGRVAGKVELTEAKPAKAAKRSTKAEGLPE